MLELFDQTVRNRTGGNMATFIKNSTNLLNDYIIQRIGNEAKAIINYVPKKISIKNFYNSLLFRIPKYFSFFRSKYSNIGHFRLSGEIHQWMYDRFSLSILLNDLGYKDIKIRLCNESYLDNWESYELDSIEGISKKPDSLYIEAIK